MSTLTEENSNLEEDTTKTKFKWSMILQALYSTCTLIVAIVALVFAYQGNKRMHSASEDVYRAQILDLKDKALEELNVFRKDCIAGMPKLSFQKIIKGTSEEQKKGLDGMLHHREVALSSISEWETMISSIPDYENLSERDKFLHMRKCYSDMKKLMLLYRDIWNGENNVVVPMMEMSREARVIEIQD